VPASPEALVEDVDNMKIEVLAGRLKVHVYNERLQLERKRLAVNAAKGLIGIFPADCGASVQVQQTYKIIELDSIMEGVDIAIKHDPPSPDVSLAFRFCNFMSPLTATGSGVHDERFLCVVFDTAPECQIAAVAFSQLCGVPLTPLAS